MLLLSTSSLSGYWLHKIFYLAKQAHYDAIDLSVSFDQFDTYDSEYIDLLARGVNIPVRSITAPEKKLNKKQFDQILMLASDLGVGIVNIHPPHRLEKEKTWFGEYLQSVAQKYPNIVINIVNAPPKTWLFLISEYGDARPETIKKMTSHTALSITNVDPSSGVDLMKTFVLLGSTMGFIYLSDKTEEDTWLFPGEGTMPLESLLIKLSDIDYTGDFALSVDPRVISAGDDATVIKRLEQAHAFLGKYFQ
jgi:sugar phosphate isomerase/epimerase